MSYVITVHQSSETAKDNANSIVGPFATVEEATEHKAKHDAEPLPDGAMRVVTVVPLVDPADC